MTDEIIRRSHRDQSRGRLGRLLDLGVNRRRVSGEAWIRRQAENL